MHIKNAQADVFRDWDAVLGAATQNAALVPGVDPFKAELEGFLAQARELKIQQETLDGQKAGITQKLKKVIAKLEKRVAATKRSNPSTSSAKTAKVSGGRGKAARGGGRGATDGESAGGAADAPEGADTPPGRTWGGIASRAPSLSSPAARSRPRSRPISTRAGRTS